MESKVKDVCHKCKLYNKKATSTYKCYTPNCPVYIKKRPRPKKRIGSFKKNDESSYGMGDGTTLGIGGVKT